MYRNLTEQLGLDQEETQSKTIPQDFEEFNKLIGLPRHPATLQEMPLMPYQLGFVNQIPGDRNGLFHINKSRQIGVTELVLRIIAYHSFFKYKGGKILIITGTREKTAAKIMHRFKQLFQNIPCTIEESRNVLHIKLVNGTEIEALPSNSEAIRGDTKIKAIFVDEAAHFRLQDDSVVIDALEPVVFTNKSDLFLVSTPNGRRGFFYSISENQNEYHKIKWDYTCAIGYIYSKDEIKKELQRNDIDTEQEYMCQFTTTRSAIFGDSFAEEEFEEEDLSWLA